MSVSISRKNALGDFEEGYAHLQLTFRRDLEVLQHWRELKCCGGVDRLGGHLVRVVIGNEVPAFWLGLLLIIVFSVNAMRPAAASTCATSWSTCSCRWRCCR